eukprot:SM000413S15642  [mRNA]  locus=s413:13687:24995:+ [translate_table: standard]
MSIVLMVNEKFRENVPAWRSFHERTEAFPAFFKCVLQLQDQGAREMTIREKINYLLFVINCFQSLEDEMVRGPVLKLVSLQLWHALSPGRRQIALRSFPQLEPLWKKLLKRESRAGKGGQAPQSRTEARFIPRLIEDFLEILNEVVRPEANGILANGRHGTHENGDSMAVDPLRLLFCERFAELMIDLLSQLRTRRFVRTLLEDVALVVKCRMSALYSHPRGRLFSQLVDLLRFYQGFEIDDFRGTQLTDAEVLVAHCDKLQALQRLLFKSMPKLRELALSNIAAVEKRSDLAKRLSSLKFEELRDLVVNKLHLASASDPWAESSDFLVEVALASFERRQSQREQLNELPLYPNEEVMWDESLVPSVNYTGEGCLALPKLNLQFLTLHDYLLRNFNLFRLESTYEIREDVHDVLKRMKARANPMDPDDITFGGWARMALPLAQPMRITDVAAPLIGEQRPASVTAELSIDVASYRGAMRAQWDELKEHDVLFVLAIRPVPPSPYGNGAEEGPASAYDHTGGSSVPKRFGLRYVRGCEVVEVKDEGGRLMNDFTGRVKREEWKPPEGTKRTLVVALDTAQYQLDVNAGVEASISKSLNVVMRRKPKENNFKAILESIRDLMNEDATVPTWLHDIFLGYGDPAAAQWHHMPPQQQLRVVDFKDTFLSPKHLLASFPGRQFMKERPEDPDPQPPYRITFSEAPLPEATATGPDSKRKAGGEGKDTAHAELVVEAYRAPDPGPYPRDQPNQNAVEFTHVQVDAIMAGVQPGLTMVVGPPGTGKTDTAVQILHVLYHNCPSQRTLLITHSNQALNDLFEKIMQRDVPARYLLRLGMGESELAGEGDFSRAGRVNAMLARRLELLAQVERLASTLSLPTESAQTCEDAAHFWLLHVFSRWEVFKVKVDAAVRSGDNPKVVREQFPFLEFFSDAPQPVFTRVFQSLEADMRSAEGCFRHLRTMFEELAECRAFELLKSTGERANYLMAKQAKVVAMTCTHAALKRRDFLKLGFKYDNLVMEESAQILEIETLIPMLLQRPQDGRARLKRCILIGDHHQLPPVVKNMAFQKYSHMDQSLFTRFVRLGVPYVELNAQGRARPAMARLYSWRYRDLGNLPSVSSPGSPFTTANAGFAHTFQLVDVQDYQGVGEMEPNPWFYQNLGEAEYIISVYQYMRLLGYPAHKISILTTYNGQKHLLRDVIERRCAGHPLFGRPSKVTTVDRFQGQQNDYILLSLVRTRVVGHLRDVRRLVVAMSRARLGLYVFCRRDLFQQCYELQPTFKLLLSRPDQLALVLAESQHPTTRPAASDQDAEPSATPPHLVSSLEEMAGIVSMNFESWQRAQQEKASKQEAAVSLAKILDHARSHGYGSDNVKCQYSSITFIHCMRLVESSFSGEALYFMSRSHTIEASLVDTKSRALGLALPALAARYRTKGNSCRHRSHMYRRAFCLSLIPSESIANSERKLAKGQPGYTLTEAKTVAKREATPSKQRMQHGFKGKSEHLLHGCNTRDEERVALYGLQGIRSRHVVPHTSDAALAHQPEQGRPSAKVSKVHVKQIRPPEGRESAAAWDASTGAAHGKQLRAAGPQDALCADAVVRGPGPVPRGLDVVDGVQRRQRLPLLLQVLHDCTDTARSARALSARGQERPERLWAGRVAQAEAAAAGKGAHGRRPRR